MHFVVVQKSTLVLHDRGEQANISTKLLQKEKKKEWCNTQKLAIRILFNPAVQCFCLQNLQQKPSCFSS